MTGAAAEAAGAAVIRLADPDDPRVAALVAEHLEEMEPTAPPESRHALTVDRFRSPAVRLWVAEAGDALVGSVALQDLGGGHLELKTMRTSRSVRGTGLGRRLLLHALAEARAAGATRVSLETGSSDVFAPARALYRAHGFVGCEPFGDYRPDRHSTFLTLPL
ncbi:GNAT family N-acetyltransferase [Phycicoccus avicenniae]|uniref:GNAT family N-acetyltransferase n=1 Tax=Phycicoccus avicenniae TaxID=2828860 RepID=UPI003D2B9E15